MEVTRREFSAETDNPVLQTFLSSNTELLHSLTADGKTAQVAFNCHQIITWGYFLTLCHLSYELKILSSRTCTTLLWSTLARTLKALPPPCSSLCSSGSSRPTRSDNARSIDSRHEWTDSADSCFSDNDEQLLLCSVSVIQPSDVDKTLFLRQQAEQENDRRKKQLVLNCDAPSSPPKPEVSGNKVTFQFPLRLFYQQLQDEIILSVATTEGLPTDTPAVY